MGTMTPRCPPKEPLVVILGSTGTGKSDLAVELATRFRGEVVNADAMQLYQGLPVITNKMTTAERRGIPHHLLDHIPLDEPAWIVGDFKRAANKVIREIRSRGNLPIVVGGTHYYTNALLFEDMFVGPGHEGQGEPAPAADVVPASDAGRFPILDEPTEVILAKLRDVDPPAAAIARRFLGGEPTPEPVSLSPLARKVLETETAGRTPCQKTCQLCQVTCTTEQDWKKHMRSKRHHAIARRTKRRALVVVEPEARPEARPEKEAEVAIAAESRDSSPEIGLSAFDLPAP
ncbi:Protein phosphatase inhibitor 2 [Verticillium dahliae VDG2]|nr:Protein phosphatase inhibitor 2 [Verticillium dahliae VDG2]